MYDKFYVVKFGGAFTLDIPVRVQDNGIEFHATDSIDWLLNDMMAEGECDTCGQSYKIKEAIRDFDDLCFTMNRGDCALEYLLPCGHVQTVINPEAKRLYNYFSGQKQWACISRIGDRYEYWYEYTYLPEQEHEHSVMELERLRHEYASTTGDTSDYAFSHWYGEIILCLAHLQMEEEERAEREKDPCDDCYNWDFCEYCKDGGNMEWN